MRRILFQALTSRQISHRLTRHSNVSTWANTRARHPCPIGSPSLPITRHRWIKSYFDVRPSSGRVRIVSLQALSTEATASMSSALATEVTGEEWYQKAVHAMEMANEMEQDNERRKSQQIHDAWERAKQAEKDPTTQSVVVVKTIAKQARKERRLQHETGTADDEDDSVISWKRRSKQYLEAAAYQHDHPIALVQLGTMVLNEAKTTKTVETKKELVHNAMDLFQRAGQNCEYRVGWYNLGQLLWSGFPAKQEVVEGNDDGTDIDGTEVILEPNVDRAMEAFGKAIEMGDPDAMYLVGVHRLSLHLDDVCDDTAGSVTVDDNKLKESGGEVTGYNLIQQAASLGHGGALYYLALLHLNGESKLEISPSIKEFTRHLDEAIDAGNADALFTRGHCYYHGSDGYPQNFVQALKDFLQAAEEGRHADAAVSAGAILHTGIDGIILRDQQKAFELYQNAGEWGSKEGWQNVVACYIAGEGVPQSLEIAEYIAETMLKTKLFPQEE